MSSDQNPETTAHIFTDRAAGARDRNISAGEVQGYTPPSADVVAWLDMRFPERDVAIAHTSSCDAASYGDECEGGCPVVTA